MLVIFNLNFLSVLFMMGVITFVSNRKHLLSMLLSLEYMSLSLFLILFLYLNMINYELFFSMMFLVFTVCEGTLGLSILVSMIRVYGNDYFQSLNSM
uniref:NADH dehydrogenase subunit 4L n=1 Tax=Halidaya aurea TaxID=1918247 RepID=UPI002001952E|nr:NADH dehydrogenase subunit 4L [Halidaya aurea]UOW81232.1 NADH dehydrogenase subunit 4L [Halidaya aurea]